MNKKFTFKSLLLLCFLIVGSSSAWATAYKAFTGNQEQGSTSISSSNVSNGTITNNNVTLISWTGVSCTYSSSRVNIAANGSITFTAASGNSITKIVMVTGTSPDYVGTWSSSSGSVSTSNDGKTVTVDGINANSVTVTTSTAYRCTSTGYIDVHYASTSPTISISPTSLTGMTYTQGNGPSTAKTFTLSGSNLTNNILVSLGDNSDFEMSMDNVTYQTADFELSKGNGTVSDKTFYVRLASGKGINTYESSVSITSEGATSKSVSLSGSVTGYTVTYNCNGGTSGCPENATNVPLGNYSLALAPSKDHYTFGGWHDGTNTYNAGATYNITGDVAFTAQWTPITHTFSTAVTPDNSGSVEAKDSGNNVVASGSSVAETAQLTLTATPADGYNFTSWSVEGTGSTLSSTTTNPTTFTMGTANSTVTATFTARTPATVTLHHGNVGATTTVVNTYTDATVGDLMAPATVNGWTTMGWVLSYTSGDPELVSSSTLIDAIDDDNHELTLYAVYTKGSNTFSRITSTDDLEVNGVYIICGVYSSTYYVLTDKDGYYMTKTSVSVNDNSFSYTVGRRFVLSGNNTDGYTFYDGTDYLTGNSSSVNYLTLDDVSDYGKWKISFDNSIAKINNKQNTSYYVSYYGSKGYFNCHTTPNTLYLFKQTSNDLQITTAPDADKCTVTYDVNGGDGTAPTDNTQYNVGATVIVADGTGLSKTGYSFNGWNTKADGTGTAHAAGSTFAINENTTLFAQWAIQSYAYTLNVIGADATATAVLKVDNENVGANAQIQYNKEVTVVVTLSDAEAYVYTVSVVNNTTSEAVTVTNNKFTMPNSAVTVTVTTVVNPYREIELTSANMTNMTGTLAYSNLKTVTVNGYTWETTGYQDSNREYVQINTTATSGSAPGSYIKIPEVGGKIVNITFSVTNGNGNNATTTLSINTTNSTSNTIADSESTSSKSRTINLNSVFCNKGYIVSNGTTRIYNIKVTYLPYSNFTDLNPEEPVPTLVAGDNYAVAADMTTEDLTIPATAGLVVKSGAKLTVTGTLTNSGTAANLVVLNGGQLNTTSANVAATMKKTITGHENNLGGGWNFIASPMSSTEIANTAHTNVKTGNFDLYRFNQSAELEWENYEAVVENTTQPLHTDFTTLDNGKGYLYANDTTIDVAFMGTLANPSSGEVSVSYNGDAALKGWNLVGNPFTCNAFLSGGFYTTGEPGAVVVACVNTTPIAPCEGAMVYVESAGTVTFSKTAPQTTNNGNMNIAVVQANERGASTTTVDKAIVSFNEGSELPKFYFGNPNANLYIPQGNKEYAIATSEAQGEMPLNFRANADGQYTLTVSPEGIEMNYLHLIDNMTGANVDLLSTPSYTFTAKTTDYESRFRLVFASSTCEDANGDNETFAFFSNGNLIVNGEGMLQVIDMLGRVVCTHMVTPNSSLPTPNYQGVYVLRLVNGNEVKTQKIVVK